MDKLVRPYVGFKNHRTDEIKWYLMGTYVMTETSYQYNHQSHALSLSCEDMMSTLNGENGGHLEGQSLKILEGTPVRGVFTDLLAQNGVSKYSVCEIPYTIPYDLEFNANVTYYDIFREILDLYPEYEMFFDIYGIFTVQKLPTCENDPIILDNRIFSQYVIEESGLSSNFKDIYNHVQVWGQAIEVDGFASSSSYSGNVYAASIPSVTSLESFKKYGVNISSIHNSPGSQLNINGLGPKNIVIDEDKPITQNYFSSAGDYAFKYRRATDDFLLLGQYQVFGEAFDANPKSPFSIENLGYELLYVCEGGDYAKIYTDDLARQRARYEIYRHTILQQTLSLQMVAIPWLNVNKKVEYKSNSQDSIYPYIVKNISGSTSDAVMQVDLTRFYPEYPHII